MSAYDMSPSAHKSYLGSRSIPSTRSCMHCSAMVTSS
jgi:hypothetical protein